MTVSIRKEDAPGTYLNEKDESGGQVNPASTRSVSVVGLFASGPINQRVRVRNQEELISTFGGADVPKYGYDWWVAYEALSETDEVYIVRVCQTDGTSTEADRVRYATAIWDGSVTGNWDETPTAVPELKTSQVVNHTDLPTGKGYTASKNIALDGMSVATSGFGVASAYAGVGGNLIGIEVKGAIKTLAYVTPVWSGSTANPLAVGDIYKDSNNHVWRVVVGGELGATQPVWPATPTLGQSVSDGAVTWMATTELRERDVLGVSAKYPEIWWKILRLRVYVKPSASVTSFTGLSVKDEFLFTLDDSQTPSGATLHAPRVVNGKGQGLVYIKTADIDELVEASFDGSEYNTSGIIGLLGGQTGSNLVTSPNYLSEIEAGWELFRHREYSAWRLTSVGVTPDLDPTYSVNKKVNNICADRMGAMYTVQVSGIKDIRKETVEMTAEGAFAGLTEPSRGAAYAGYDRRRDPISGRLVWLPKSIEGLRAILKASRVANDAQAPAGAEVSVCRGFEQNVEFTKIDCGYLYARNINVSIKKPEGNVMWGQKTMQRVESKRDRINVRRILDKIGIDLEQIGDALIWKNISPTLIERLYSALDRNLEQRSGEGYFDVTTKEAGKGYRIKITRNGENKNRLDARVEVMPIDTLEWIGIELVVTDSGVESVTETA